MRISNAKEAMVGKSCVSGCGVGDDNFLAGNFHDADWRDAGAGDDSLIGACSPRMQAGSQGSGLLRSTQKIGQKTELTATNGLEQASSANQGLWRETA